MKALVIFICFYGFACYGKTMTFENLLRKHGIKENSISILIGNGITDTKTLQALDKDDIKDLDLNLGQRALLWELIKKLAASSGEEPHSRGQGERRQNEYVGKSETKRNNLNPDDALANMSEANFWCLFKCLGGIGAVGLGGILALVGLVTYGLPAIGLVGTGIIAGSLAAKIMALYGGNIATGSLIATLQSVAAAGISWKAILTAFFGGGAVMSAIQGQCAHCFD